VAWRAAVAPVKVGSLLGPYRIVGELGRGGMGIIYRAVHGLLGRPAAIKVLRPELADDALAVERLQQEARATATVRHAGVVEVFDYGHSAAGPYIAMELLEGEPLGQRIATRGRLSVAEAIAVARRIAIPLAATHARGVVHRDLKPDNVFLVGTPPASIGETMPPQTERLGLGDEQVKLVDFGIAKLEGQPDKMRAADGMVAGTPAYMAPEQCVGTGDCDHRADLYALGCILFEMLAGRSPYALPSPRSVLVAHVRAPVPDLAEHVKVPAELSTLVACLLAKDPNDRPNDALEVADLLAEIESWVALAPNQTDRQPALDEVDLAGWPELAEPGGPPGRAIGPPGRCS
jgi:serine/threonine-protein kinase